MAFVIFLVPSHTRLVLVPQEDRRRLSAPLTYTAFGLPPSSQMSWRTALKVDSAMVASAVAHSAQLRCDIPEYPELPSTLKTNQFMFVIFDAAEVVPAYPEA